MRVDGSRVVSNLMAESGVGSGALAAFNQAHLTSLDPVERGTAWAVLAMRYMYAAAGYSAGSELASTRCTLT